MKFAWTLFDQKENKKPNKLLGFLVFTFISISHKGYNLKLNPKIMATYLITYDLIKPETSEDYHNLIDYIKGLGPWANPQKSVWLVASNTTSCAQIRDQMMRFADQNDKLLIIEVWDKQWATLASQEINNWMSQYVK